MSLWTGKRMGFASVPMLGSGTPLDKPSATGLDLVLLYWGTELNK